VFILEFRIKTRDMVVVLPPLLILDMDSRIPYIFRRE
jgi:hypothetical protein